MLQCFLQKNLGTKQARVERQQEFLKMHIYLNSFFIHIRIHILFDDVFVSHKKSIFN
jgi:hypothetical protein